MEDQIQEVSRPTPIIPDALQPVGYTKITQSQFSEQQREAGTRYPHEVFNADYYKLIHSPEEHYQSLMKGWTDEQPQDHAYVPYTESPEHLEMIQGQLAAKAEKERQEALSKSSINGTISIDQVQELVRQGIEAALRGSPAIFAQARETPNQARRGPGRPRTEA